MANQKKKTYQKVGFQETLEILMANDGKMKLRAFFKEFNQESNYNAFYRIKNYMTEHHLITLEGSIIYITSKGIQILVLMDILKTVIEG